MQKFLKIVFKQVDKIVDSMCYTYHVKRAYGFLYCHLRKGNIYYEQKIQKKLMRGDRRSGTAHLVRRNVADRLRGQYIGFRDADKIVQIRPQKHENISVYESAGIHDGSVRIFL